MGKSFYSLSFVFIKEIFEEKIRRNSLYFAWVPNKSGIPEKNFSTKKRIIGQIFKGNMVLFFVIFLLISVGFFFVATTILNIPPCSIVPGSNDDST